MSGLTREAIVKVLRPVDNALAAERACTGSSELREALIALDKLVAKGRLSIRRKNLRGDQALTNRPSEPSPPDVRSQGAASLEGLVDRAPPPFKARALLGSPPGRARISFLALAGRNLHYANDITDRVSGALLSFRAFRHVRTVNED